MALSTMARLMGAFSTAQSTGSLLRIVQAYSVVEYLLLYLLYLRSDLMNCNCCFPRVSLLFLGLLAAAISPPVLEAGLYSTAVLNDSPLAYYRMNETAGSTAVNIGAATGIDASYQNIPGATATNTSDYGQPGPALPGFEASNRSVLFDPEDGSSDASDTPLIQKAWNAVGTDPLALDGSTGLTVEAWVRRAAPTVTGSDNEGIAGRYQQNGAGLGSGGRSYMLYYDDDINAFALAISETGSFTSAGVLEATDYDVPLGEWLHVAGTYTPPSGADPATLAIYVNGLEVGSRDTTVGSLFTGAADFWIGQQFTTADNWTFEGNIDEVAIYASALSPETIRDHYLAAVPEPAGLALISIGLFLLGRSRSE